MKKFIKLLFVFMLVVFLAGCKGKEVVTKCNYESNQETSGYKIVTDYEIYSRDELATKVVKKEKIISKNNTILAYFKDQFKKQYESNNKNYKGYSYEVSDKKGETVSIVTIDYSKVDMDKFIKDNPAMKSFVNKSNQPTYKGIKTMYESMGAKCDK